MKIKSILVMMLLIAVIAVPGLGMSGQFHEQYENTTLANPDVTLGTCITTDYVNGWQDHGLRIKEWPIDGVVYAYVEVYADDLSGVMLTHRWWYDNGSGLANVWDWNWEIPEPWVSCWSYTYWDIGLDLGKGWGYIEVLADGVSLGTSNNYAMDNTQPNKPTIAGKTSGGAGVEYEYTFSATDPDGFDLYYIIDWCSCGEEVTIGPYASGQEVKASYTWEEQGDYTISCRVKDLVDNESETTTLDVSMPKNKANDFNFNLVEWLFERYPNAFPFLRHILEL